jgi:acyl carrier protein
MENKLKNILATVLEINENKIDKNTSADTVENWDSLKQMNIIVALEEEFNIEFNEEETFLLNNYQLLLESIKNKIQN